MEVGRLPAWCGRTTLLRRQLSSESRACVRNRKEKILVALRHRTPVFVYRTGPEKVFVITTGFQNHRISLACPSQKLMLVDDQ